MAQLKAAEGLRLSDLNLTRQPVFHVLCGLGDLPEFRHQLLWEQTG